MSELSTELNIKVAAENALIVYFPSSPSPGCTEQIQQLQRAMREQLGHKLIDLVPSFTSLLVLYDLIYTDHFEIRAFVYQAWDEIKGVSDQQNKGKNITLPVYYALESGPDLPVIAKQSNLSIDQVIKLHCDREYLVYSIGFAPGFAYLGEVDSAIATPRLTTPRASVPQGAVGIADRQTAVYPSSSPGGWNIIGLCPTPLFDVNKLPCMPFEVGDTVTFSPIDKAAFLSLGGTL